MTIKPLPRRPAPIQDELLSSWIVRLAQANHCSGEQLCGYLGFEKGRVPEWSSDLRRMKWDRLSFAVQRTRDEIAAMTLPETGHLSVPCVARHDFQCCLGCTEQIPGLVLRHWRFAWSLRCEICGQALQAVHSENGVSGKLRIRAGRGAEVLRSAVTNRNRRVLRRAELAMYLLNVLGMGYYTSLTSGNERARLTALAMIGTCTSRPLVKSAIVLRGNPKAAWELRRVFPQHRRIIDKIGGLSRVLDRRLPRQPQNETRSRVEWNSKPAIKASGSALAAARQAISELGSAADSQALLARADMIWKSQRCAENQQA